MAIQRINRINRAGMQRLKLSYGSVASVLQAELGPSSLFHPFHVTCRCYFGMDFRHLLVVVFTLLGEQ